jgi:pimeloyl-ACP methyl ester carboxylesterase
METEPEPEAAQAIRGLEIEHNALRNLAHLAAVRGDRGAAARLRAESLGVARRLGAERRVAFELPDLGEGELAQGPAGGRAARAAFAELLTLARRLDDRWLWERAAAGLAAAGAPAPPAADRPEAEPGRLVEATGRRLYVRRPQSAGARPPGVVFEAGRGDAWGTWEAVLDRVAAFAPAVAYSRAGLAPSDPGPLPRTGRRIADDLRALLAALGGALGPPYVLVGHSFGALAVRHFAARHPEAVAGLVLLDGAHEDDLTGIRRRQAERPEPEWAPRDGWYRGGNPREHADVTGSMEALAALCQAPLPPTLPVAVVASGWTGANYHLEQPRPGQRPRDAAAARAAAARRFGAGARFVLAERSGHYIQRDQPELVVDTIRAVVEAAAGAA